MLFLSMSLGVFASEVPNGEMAGADNVSIVSGEEVAYVVTGSDEALLSSINEQLAEVTTPSLFNPNGTQATYFKTYLATRPFADYVITYDGEQDYVMYYGYGLEDRGEYVRIYRTSTGGYNYNYVVTTGTGAIPSGNIFIDTREGANGFAEIEQLKVQTFVGVSLLLLVGLWILSKILFR